MIGPLGGAAGPNGTLRHDMLCEIYAGLPCNCGGERRHNGDRRKSAPMLATDRIETRLERVEVELAMIRTALLDLNTAQTQFHATVAKFSEMVTDIARSIALMTARVE